MHLKVWASVSYNLEGTILIKVKIVVPRDLICLMEALDVRSSDISARCVTRAWEMFGK